MWQLRNVLTLPLLFALLLTNGYSYRSFRTLSNKRIAGETSNPDHYHHRHFRPTRLLSTTSELLFETYDGDLIDKYYKRRPFEVWERLVNVGSPILGWWMLKTFDNATAPFRTAAENQVRLNQRAEDLKDAIVQGKSITFIKSGQALALRPDLVKSAEYVRELQKLQDEVGTFPNSIAMQTIRDDLGAEPSSLFVFDPPDPIASASIGQVYRCILRSTNETVALKVQRPDAVQYAAIDMYILRQIAAFVKRRKKLNSNLVGIADEFGKQLFNELNYTREAQNCMRFRELYGEIPGIYVPFAYYPLTARRVLTMEFVEGVKGPWLQGGEKMLTIGLQCSVLQLLGTGFFHSDPHRGNLLQTPRGELAYLDFGMMSEVPAEKRFALIGTVLGLINKDISMVITNMKELEFFPPETDTTVVVNALDSALSGAMQNGQGSTLNFTQLNTNLERISDLLPFRLPPFYSMIIRSLTILEGLALVVDKDFRLVRGAYPFIARQILSEPSPEMNALLRSVLLTEEGRIKWEKLEQFISISSNADEAMKGNFTALKSAQDKSDILKSFQQRASSTPDNVEDSASFSYEVVTQILDYLLSENGQFLRDPLVDEIVETIDSLGLTALTIASLATNRLIPAPEYKPDREKVMRFLKLMNTIARKPLERAQVALAFTESDGALSSAFSSFSSSSFSSSSFSSSSSSSVGQKTAGRITALGEKVKGKLGRKVGAAGVGSVPSVAKGLDDFAQSLFPQQQQQQQITVAAAVVGGVSGVGKGESGEIKKGSSVDSRASAIGGDAGAIPSAGSPLIGETIPLVQIGSKLYDLLVGAVAGSSTFSEAGGGNRGGKSEGDEFGRSALEELEKMQPLLSKSAALVNDVVVRLIELNTRRALIKIASPGAIERVLPSLATLLDLLPRAPTKRGNKQRKG